MRKGTMLLKKALLEMEKKQPDLAIAFEFLSQSADLGNHEAKYAIGTWYLHGQFVKKNPATAISFFWEATKGKVSSAYFDLAICYEKGIGERKNHALAFKCYLNAALLGDKQSFYEIGRCYYYGIGITKDKEVANIWLVHAHENGIND